MTFLSILHLSPHYGGGVGAVVSSLSDALKSGYNTKSVYVSLEPPVSSLPSNIIPIFLDYLTSPISATDSLTELISKADLVLCHYWNHPLLSFLLSTFSFNDIPVIFWTHTSGFHPLNPIPHSLITVCSQVVYSSSASLSLPLPDSIPEYLRPTSIHSTRNLATFSELFKFRQHSLSPKNVLYAGTISRAKMHHNSIMIFKELSKSFDIYFVGEPTDDELYSALSRLERVHFLGYKECIHESLLYADCLVYPLSNTHYGTGEQILLEALSSGLPAICLDNASERAIIQHEHTGLLCCDPNSLITSTLQLMNNPQKLHEFSRRAHLFTSERFSMTAMGTQFNELFLQAAISLRGNTTTFFKRRHPDPALSALISATFPCFEFDINSSTSTLVSKLSQVFKSMPLTANVLLSPSKGTPFQYQRYFPHSSYIRDICSHLSD